MIKYAKSWKHYQKKATFDLKSTSFLAIYGLLTLAIFTGLTGWNVYQSRCNRNLKANLYTDTVHQDFSGKLPVSREASLKSKIINFASENKVDAQVALKIAECESQFGLLLFNPESSAKGIYQFTDKTWENYCEGDVLNTNDNIKCFTQLYNKHPNWWKCNS